MNNDIHLPQILKSKLFIAVLVLFFIGTLGFICYQYVFLNSHYVNREMPSATTVSEKISPPNDFKVAFLADQGVTKNSKKVLKLVKSEGAFMVIHPGDFDYKNNPEKWDKMINDTLGRDFPYFIAVGNHDVPKWKGYQKKFAERLDRIKGDKCEGELGVNSVCTYKGLRFLLSGVGTLGNDDAEYIDKTLPNNDFEWQICAWHKNQRLMQTGGKTDEVGWGHYETCRKEGAIIATGHEHTYSRTYLMSDFKNQIVASTSNVLKITKGKSFAFVSGIAGKSVRPQNDDISNRKWWASVYTASQDAKPGALFCTFSPGGEKNKADCYFKDIDEKVIDKFILVKS